MFVLMPNALLCSRVNSNPKRNLRMFAENRAGWLGALSSSRTVVEPWRLSRLECLAVRSQELFPLGSPLTIA